MSGPGKIKYEPVEDPTLEGIAPQELIGSTPPAERWILNEIRKMQKYDAMGTAHRRKAMAGIAERFHQRVYRYCLTKLPSNREEAEDVVQDVFQDLEPLLVRVENEEHLRKLIFRLAKNKCADVYNRMKRVQLAEEVRPMVASSMPVEESFTNGINSEQLRAAIRNLPKLEDRILLTLSLDFRMPIRQIAGVLEITEGACKMRRHRARQKLKTLLQDSVIER